VRIRPAVEADVGLLLQLIRELAEYERLSEEAVGTAQQLHEHLFGDRRVAEAAIAEIDGEPAGFVLWFTTFSTFLARPGAWVEDIYVRPEHRGAGIGRALLSHVASVAVERGWGRLELAVLDWNEPSIGFYRALGARSMKEWLTQRFEGDALRTLASQPTTSPASAAVVRGSTTRKSM
jgi:GNAT superfamily N-acetyltransferase